MAVGATQRLPVACADDGAGTRARALFVPPLDAPTTVFVAKDVDRAWHELGPYLVHEVRSYAEWNEGNTHTQPVVRNERGSNSRAENRSHRILSVDEAIEFVRSGAPLQLHPLIGGLPPDIAWRYLSTVENDVLPAVGTRAMTPRVDGRRA